jgi:hypothetical protein
VLVVTSDDQGWNTMGCTGNRPLEKPCGVGAAASRGAAR